MHLVCQVVVLDIDIIDFLAGTKFKQIEHKENAKTMGSLQVMAFKFINLWCERLDRVFEHVWLESS